MVNDDMALLRAYVASQSEQAFETLVGRYINLVYSAALRQARDPHLAEEITQTVFVILARKANTLGANTILPSWLHRTAGFCAADALKTQRRRVKREQEAYMQSPSNEPDHDAWPQIAPLLDAAIARLNEKDRHAIVLRFFQNKTLNEIGAALGANEETAKKRVHRALEKMRGYFFRQGVNSTAETIAGAMSANSVIVAPATLAKVSAAMALAKGAAASASTLALSKGALNVMAWTKTKTAITAGVVISLLALLTMSTIFAVHKHLQAIYAQQFQGAWEGTISIVPNSTGIIQSKPRLVVKVFQEDGAYHVMVDQIDRGIKNVPATTLAISKLSIDFASDSFRYHGVFHKNQSELRGTWVSDQGGHLLVLERTDHPDTVAEPLAEEDYTPRPGSDLQGLWKTTIKSKTSTVPAYLKIAEPTNGTFRAELNRINGKAFVAVPVTTLTYDKPRVQFVIGDPGVSFTGNLDDKGTAITGKWKQGGTQPLTFARVDPTDEEQMLELGKNYSNTNDAELQGHWSGTLPGISGVPLRVVFHIAQMPDGSFSATMDSPDQSLFNIPLNSVEYAPPHVRMELKSAQCVFDGKLAHNELSGTWTCKKTPEHLAMERDISN